MQLFLPAQWRQLKMLASVIDTDTVTEIIIGHGIGIGHGIDKRGNLFKLTPLLPVNFS